MLGAGFLDRAEPSLIDKLKQPMRRRGRGARRRVEIRFHLGGGEQIFEASTARARGLLDRTRNAGARDVDACRCRGVRWVDRHALVSAPRETIHPACSRAPTNAQATVTVG